MEQFNGNCPVAPGWAGVADRAFLGEPGMEQRIEGLTAFAGAED